MKTMRPQRAVLLLAFLSAAFMLGCQDQGLEPVGPESLGILLDKGPIHSGGHGGGGGGDATFTATMTPNVTSVADIGLTGKTSLQTDPGTPGVAGSPAMLNLSFFRTALSGGTTCFNTGTVEMPASEFTGPFQIIVKKNDLDNANIQFNFPAKGDEGTLDVNYGLQLPGVITIPDNWPPAPDVDNTITGTTFNMVHSNGPGNKVACTGTGVLNFSILVVRDPVG